jgi:predicted nucleotidyltransferase
MDKSRAIEIVNKYILVLKKEKLNLKHAYLFGSYSNGKNNDDSDIDIALVISDKRNRIDMQSMLIKLTKEFDYIIEPHPIKEQDFNIDNPFASEILKTGIKLL